MQSGVAVVKLPLVLEQYSLVQIVATAMGLTNFRAGLPGIYQPQRSCHILQPGITNIACAKAGGQVLGNLGLDFGKRPVRVG